MKAIYELIKTKEEITVADFMKTAMYHDIEGYYITQNPLGINGDFITAPEISQLFGEMIGVYSANAWFNLGKPDKFNLIELGPGKATLIQDLLRATKHVEGFHQAMQIHLVDTNKYLVEVQKEALKVNNVIWHNNIFSLPEDAPTIIIANEFFDCLPINQFIKEKGQWLERAIKLNQETQEFYFTKIKTDNFIENHPNSVDGSIVEICNPAKEIMRYLSKLIKKVKGCFLIIDYGYDYNPLTRVSYGETIQALKSHKFQSIFRNIGKADLTAHVDFFALKYIASEEKCNIYGTITQKDFLQQLGINTRYETLKRKATPSQKLEIDLGLNRLLDDKQMGSLFKVMEVTSY